MRRFFLEEIIREDNGTCIIGGGEARHITRVLRMDRGDSLILMDRQGGRYSAVIESVDGSDVVVSLSGELQGPQASLLDITLCQAVLKSGPMDYLVEKTSELGVTRIMPFSSERTVVKIKDNPLNKVRRWREIAVSAAKQSDRGIPAEIASPSSFTDLLGQGQGDDVLRVILWEREDARDLKDLLKRSDRCPGFVGMVGPEGGFSANEVDAALKAGFVPVSLGRRILRAETAAITLVALVQYEWGDLSLSSSP